MMDKLLVFLFGVLIFSPSALASKVITYPFANGAPRSQDFEVRVSAGDGKWQVVPVYQWLVDRVENGRHSSVKSSVASFDFEGTVTVMVKSRYGEIASCRVRPLSYNIPSNALDSAVQFTIDRPRNLSVEINGDIFHNLHLFANEIKPKPKKTKDVIYYGPGYYDLKGDSVLVKSGQTLFIDGGTYIKGWVSLYNANNSKVLGHGIVNPERQHEGIMVRYSRNITIDGPLTTQVPVGQSDSVSIKNTKCISWYGWGDGMNVFASNNVSYDNVFCRTSDDCSTIYCSRKGYQGDCSNIRVNHAVYWADVAHPIMIGLHGDINKNEVIDNVTYHDVDILDQAERQIDYQGCIGINVGDNNLVKNIVFDDIRIESLRYGMLFNLRVCYNKKYCHAPGRGIQDVWFKNIRYDGVSPNMSIIAGYDEDRKIKGVHFENLIINGLKISDNMPTKPSWYKTSDYANIFVGEHVEDITFK